MTIGVGHKMIFVGDLWYGSTALMRLSALKKIFHLVIELDSTCNTRSLFSRCVDKFLPLFGNGIDYIGLNSRLLDAFNEIESNDNIYLWLDKSLTISPDTLANLKKRFRYLKIVGYSPDDMGRVGNQSHKFLRSSHLYDIFITTKSFNVDELGEGGFKKVIFVNNGYDPSLHVPFFNEQIEINALKIYDVTFIGAWEDDRVLSMMMLRDAGINVEFFCWGSHPKFFNIKKLDGIKIHPPVWGREYVEVIQRSRINLGFLRKINRDLQTTRSIEIPACGSFMIAERTSEHQALFLEGKEAEFFSNNSELLLKVKYFLANSLEREHIAKSGYERCISSGYSYEIIFKGLEF
jgi:spore maturation protein CgeB